MLNKNLKKYRNLKKLSQEEMAEKLDISRPAYTGYETGRRKPSLDMLYKISDILEVSIDDLSGIKKESTNLLEDAEVLMFSDKEGWDELSDDRKKEIMRELSDLADFYIEKDKKAKGEQ
ncbi:helix-turn-helix transcriptional regulator [Mammaliicoccus sciuri]|uniref:Helix-turn-helix transcriptional regulator n=1 Tax=Mammaliicoccus sciuri TaxID=1296 RepID=A0AAW5LL24_MAMSC|nr:helix-turn-helix transcriptional regulator [Mammaliicoccus sciuri]MBF9297241.1 helix-turn-helix transcriptional regulator [Staphylococcus schleiferi]MCQ9303104.1 helix-turn-helix transcriptional regulator [Mammaliicoccus sciuri]